MANGLNVVVAVRDNVDTDIDETRARIAVLKERLAEERSLLHTLEDIREAALSAAAPVAA